MPLLNTGVIVFAAWFVTLGTPAGFADQSTSQTGNSPGGIDWPQPKSPILAAHYFGRHWATNFISAFRREDVASDFARIRGDGFNTVIFVVSWGDFQPVIDPCCTYDQRAFRRLRFLINRAREAQLHVMLRIGYLWTYRPGAEDVGHRTQLLVDDESARKAFIEYVQRLADEIRYDRHVVMSFLAWEDHFPEFFNPRSDTTIDRWLASLPSSRSVERPTLPLRRIGDDVRTYHRYWDWLAINELLKPAKKVLPNLSYEVRIDKEPVFDPTDETRRSVIEWVGHEEMYQLPGDGPITIYWAPFWGARNIGEKLSAEEALHLLRQLLQETQEKTDGRPIFIDQFNFIDNTPGVESNASIVPDQIGTFLQRSLCVMKNHGVIGYGLWTRRNYRESRLYNPSFSFGLDGWGLEQTDSDSPAAALRPLPSGDLKLVLATGDTISQTMTRLRGRLPFSDQRPDKICLRAAAKDGGAVMVRAGSGAPVQLTLNTGIPREYCSLIESEPTGDKLTLQLTVVQGVAEIYDIWFFDHIQEGGVYDVNDDPGPFHDSIRRLNRDFGHQKAPDYCTG